METRPNELAPVSVVIPCYNCKETIHRAVKSVFDQTWRPSELILVDDASTDSTPEVLFELQKIYGKDWIKVVVLKENKGPGSARNTGWDIATQPYVAFLDADDAWHPNKIAIQLKYMLKKPDVAITGHYVSRIKENEFIIEDKQFFENYKVTTISKQRFLLKNLFSTPSVILQREISYRFQSNKRYSEDYLLWLQIVLSGLKAGFINANLAYIFKTPYGEGGLSARLLEMEKGELDTYLTLLRFKKISFFLWMLLSIYSIAKFILRLIKRALSIQK